MQRHIYINIKQYQFVKTHLTTLHTMLLSVNQCYWCAATTFCLAFTHRSTAAFVWGDIAAPAWVHAI